MTKKELTCIVCPIGCKLLVEKTDKGWLVTGNTCPRGEKYAITEMTAPMRIVTSTAKIKGSIHPVIPVKTSGEIPKGKIMDVMQEISKIELQSPAKLGTVAIKNVLNLGVDIVTSKAG